MSDVSVEWFIAVVSVSTLSVLSRLYLHYPDTAAAAAAATRSTVLLYNF